MDNSPNEETATEDEVAATDADASATKADDASDAPERAHNEDGTFKADDLDTPDVNEAFEPEDEAPAKKAGDVTVIVSHVDPVFVNVNGKRRFIERDVEVSIPSEMVEVLETAGISVTKV